MSISSKPGLISSAEDNVVSLTIQHCLNVIRGGHLSDNQLPVLLQGREVLKHPSPVPKMVLSELPAPAPALPASINMSRCVCPRCVQLLHVPAAALLYDAG